MRKEKSNILNLLSFNIGCLVPSKDAWKRLMKFVETLQNDETLNKSPDVIMLQELWPYNMRQEVKELLLNIYPFILDLDNTPKMITKFFPKKMSIDSGLMILSKYKINNPKRIIFVQNGYLSRFFDGEILVNKGAIGGTIKLEDELIFIATTHLVSHYPHCSYRYQRRKQIDQLTSWIKIESDKNSIVLSGDFNVSPPSIDGSQRYLETDKRWSDLKDSISKVIKNYNHIDYNKHQSTFHNYDNLNNNVENNVLDSVDKTKDEGCLDHFFSSEKLEILNSRVKYNVAVGDNERFFISDHSALEIEIDLKK